MILSESFLNRTPTPFTTSHGNATSQIRLILNHQNININLKVQMPIIVKTTSLLASNFNLQIDTKATISQWYIQSICIFQTDTVDIHSHAST